MNYLRQAGPNFEIHRLSALAQADARLAAAEILRGLIERIELTPENGTLAIRLCGDLASILNFASDSKRPGAVVGVGSFGHGMQESLVAGVGFEPTTFRL